MSSLKEKLEQKLGETFAAVEPEEKPMVVEEDDNVIPFRKNEVEAATTLVPDFAVSIAQARERIAMLQQFVREMMVAGVDYGYIPNCPKPTLLKPGAEKLTDIYGFSKHVEVINRVEDWEKGIFAYEVRTTLISKRTGLIEAQGVGSCNSREKKYRHQDSFSVCNTVLKMAKKRALIDAVLSATRSSGLFSQDLEDMSELMPTGDKQQEQPMQQKTSTTPENVQPSKDAPVNKKQLTEIFRLVEEKKLPVSEVKNMMLERYNVKESKELTTAQLQDFIAYLKDLKPKKQRKATTATNA